VLEQALTGNVRKADQRSIAATRLLRVHQQPPFDEMLQFGLVRYEQ
jgi:hypothetical protein